jgi:hypothetical protein
LRHWYWRRRLGLFIQTFASQQTANAHLFERKLRYRLKLGQIVGQARRSVRDRFDVVDFYLERKLDMIGLFYHFEVIARPAIALYVYSQTFGQFGDGLSFNEALCVRWARIFRAIFTFHFSQMLGLKVIVKELKQRKISIQMSRDLG